MSDDIKKKKETANEVAKATSILVIASFLSRILGYARDIVITSTFGIGYDSDAYSASFTIPDMIYYCLVGGALSTAFIPVFRKYITNGKDEEGHRMASTILNLVAGLAAILCLLGEIFAPQVVGLICQYEGAKFQLTVLLTRIMFCQSFFMCLTGIAQGILQSYKNFTASSIGGILYNIVIIVVGYLLSQVFGLGVMGFSIGVVAAAVVNFVVQLPAIKSYGFKYMPVIDLKHEGVKNFFLLLLPVLLGLSMNELNVLANQYFGSGLGDSVLTSLKQAERIQSLPVGIFCSSIGISIFPVMTEHFAKGEIDNYKNDLTSSLKSAFFIAIPCTIGLIAVRLPLIRVMYLQGKTTEENVANMATLLMVYCIGIIGYSAQQILNRAFYAIQDTKTPVSINVFILLLNIGLSALFVKLLGAPGLPLAYSTSGITSMIILTVFLRKKVGKLGLKSVFICFGKTLLAGIAMWVVVYFLNNFLETNMNLGRKIFQLVEVLIEAAAGAGVFALAAYLLKIDEFNSLLEMLMRKLHIKKKGVTK